MFMQPPKPKVSPATNYSIVFIEREKPKAKIIRFCNSILLVGSLRAKAVFNPDQTTLWISVAQKATPFYVRSTYINQRGFTRIYFVFA
jgi:hypothetical protein